MLDFILNVSRIIKLSSIIFLQISRLWRLCCVEVQNAFLSERKREKRKTLVGTEELADL